MNTKQIRQALIDMDIDSRSISFYQQIEEDRAVDHEDTEFGTCDLAGLVGNLVSCTALTLSTGEITEFQALESLVGGALGRVAGAI